MGFIVCGCGVECGDCLYVVVECVCVDEGFVCLGGVVLGGLLYVEGVFGFVGILVCYVYEFVVGDCYFCGLYCWYGVVDGFVGFVVVLYYGVWGVWVDWGW